MTEHVVWVTINVGGTEVYHWTATCHQNRGPHNSRRVPTIEAAAKAVGLRSCKYCGLL